MKFLLIDKIHELQPGRRIVTSKSLSLAEEYLGDHFPDFPVLPGVLMIEAMTQSAAWLVRLEQDFSHSVVVLQSARNVRYSYFLKPGHTLRCEVDVVEIGPDKAKFKAGGYVGEKLTVSSRLELGWRKLADHGHWGRDVDERIVRQLKKQFELLGGPAALEDQTARA